MLWGTIWKAVFDTNNSIFTSKNSHWDHCSDQKLHIPWIGTLTSKNCISDLCNVPLCALVSQMKLQQQKFHLGPPPRVLPVRRPEEKGSYSEDVSLMHSLAEISEGHATTQGALSKVINIPLNCCMLGYLQTETVLSHIVWDKGLGILSGWNECSSIRVFSSPTNELYDSPTIQLILARSLSKWRRWSLSRSLLHPEGVVTVA